MATETSRKFSGLPSTAMPEPQRAEPITGRHGNTGHHQLPSKTWALHILAATSKPRTIRGVSSMTSITRL